jgi:hypothetical protein
MPRCGGEPRFALLSRPGQPSGDKRPRAGRPAACQRTSNGRRRSGLRRIVWIRTSKAFMVTSPSATPPRQRSHQGRAAVPGTGGRPAGQRAVPGSAHAGRGAPDDHHIRVDQAGAYQRAQVASGPELDIHVVARPGLADAKLAIVLGADGRIISSCLNGFLGRARLSQFPAIRSSCPVRGAAC